MTYKQRQTAIGLIMSNEYIYDLAVAHELKHWQAKKRLELTLAVVAQRLL
jgi:hypothetical protein